MRNPEHPSTRAQTKASGVFTRSSVGSHSLERGLLLVRSFLGGAVELTNAEMAARCELPRSTVSRLTRSLVDAGFLEYDAMLSVYRLAPVYASLATAYGQSHSWWISAKPLLHAVAQRNKLNVGLCVRDGLHLVYLEMVRATDGPVQRVLSSGSRVGIEAFASGHALIASLPDLERTELYQQLSEAHRHHWPAIRRRIEQSRRQCRREGFCLLPSVPGLISIATPIEAPDGTHCSVMLSAQDDGRHDWLLELPQVLRALALQLSDLWSDTSAMRHTT